MIGQHRESRELSPREAEILELLSTEGLTNKAIAERLDISPSTVKTHIERLAAILNLHTRVELAVWAYESGWLRERRQLAQLEVS